MTQLCAASLANDPRIAQAIALLKAAVREHQASISAIRPPVSELVTTYRAMIEELSELRGGKLYYPFLGSGIGNGTLVELLDGSVKYDFISGIGVHYLGHSHPDLITAGIQAAISDTVMQGNLQQNGDSLQLCQTLVQAAGMSHCLLTNSGAMANENALKLALQRLHPASRILAFSHCFSGRTWSLSQITDKPLYRQGLPSTIFVDYVPFFNAKDPEGSTAAAVNTLKEHLARYPRQHAVMFFELVQGEGGFHPGSKEFFTQLMTLCRENGVAVLADEVQTFGRLPKLFAYQYFGVQDFVDIVTIGKLSQVCATLFTKDFYPKAGLLSQTYTASTSAIRASSVILHHLLKEHYLGEDGKIARIGSYFTRRLMEIEQRHPTLIQGPYGIGAMIAFTPLGGDHEHVTRFVHALFQAGVISFIAGSNPTRVRFLIPVGAVTEQDIDIVCTIIEQVLIDVANSEPRAGS